MKDLGRAIGASVGVSISVGAAFATAVVLASERQPLLPRLSATLLSEVAFIGLLASVFVSVPAGVLGGVVAGTMLRKHRTMPRRQWLVRGAGVGCGIGASSALLYALLLSGFDFSADAGLAIAFYLIAGAVSGGLCGVIMGWWCSSQGAHPREAWS